MEALDSQREHELSSCGLWSWDRGFARPLMPSTPLESPALACTRLLTSPGKMANGRHYNRLEYAPGKACFQPSSKRKRCSQIPPPRTSGLYQISDGQLKDTIRRGGIRDITSTR